MQLLPYSLLCFFISNALIYSQPTFFEKTFGDATLGEKGIASIQIASGAIFTIGQANQDISLTKLTANGELIWQKTYGTDRDDYPNNFLQYEEHSFIIAGESFGTSLDGLLLKVDTLGNEQWLKTYDFFEQSESFYSLDKTTTGDLVICGFATGEGEGNDILVSQFNPEGEPIWTRKYGGNKNEVGVAVKVNSHDEYIIASDYETINNVYNVYVMSLDNLGTFQWEVAVDNEFNGGCKNMIINTAGDYLIVGEQGTATNEAFDMYLTKISQAGNLLWTKPVFGHRTYGDAGFDLMETANEHYILTGYAYHNESQKTDIGVVYVSPEGELIDHTFYGGTAYDIAYDIIPSIYGGYIITGASTVNIDNQYFIIYDNAFASTNLTHSFINTPLTIYPNPLMGNRLYFNRPLKNGQLTLIDMQGKNVYSAQFQEPTTYQVLPNLQQGAYFLEIKTSSGSWVQKIWKH